MSPLDLTDPAVRSMAERDHQPAETWTVAGTLIGVYCETCRQAWPCETVQALRAIVPLCRRCAR